MAHLWLYKSSNAINYNVQELLAKGEVNLDHTCASSKLCLTVAHVFVSLLGTIEFPDGQVVIRWN